MLMMYTRGEFGGIWIDVQLQVMRSLIVMHKNIYLPFALHVSTYLSVFSSQDFVEHISSQKKKK